MGLKHIVIVLPLALAFGCTKNVALLKAEVVERSDDNVLLEIETDKNLSEFEKSKWADHVYLQYKVEGTTISDKIEMPRSTGLWEYPFHAEKININVICNINSQYYCSMWRIPLKASTSINAWKYEYSISEKVNKVTVKIGGGNMGCCFLESNEREFNIWSIPNKAH